VTPKVFSGAGWGLFATHNISVSANAQALAGSTYVFGRWSDNGAAAHAITLTPPVGGPGLSAPVPAVTVYSANFVQLVNFSSSVFPAASGAIGATPPAQAYPGAAGVYYVARQPVQLTATPASGFGFVEWSTSGAPFISPPWSANPKTELAPGNIIAYFSNQPITTITTSPSGYGVTVDGGFWYTPQNFSSDFFPSWTIGSSHVVAGLSPQLPYSINSRALFTAWSDLGAQTHNYVAPAVNATLTATMQPQYAPIAYAAPSCGANVFFSPPSPAGDGFYNSGSTVSVTATPAAGFILTGWLYDLSGAGNPQNLVVNDEELAVANFNASATPLAISSLNPSLALAGAGGLTVAINGTGFTPSTLAYVSNFFRASQFVSPTQMSLALSAADLASPGAFPIAVGNFPPGAPCGAYTPHSFAVGIP